MPPVTVPRTDLSTQEMVTVLRDGWGPEHAPCCGSFRPLTA